MRAMYLAGIVLGMATPVSAAELITNGGFETGTFAGWTRTGALGNSGVSALAARSGAFGAFFSPNSTGSIAQDLTTLAGETYVVAFDLAHTTGGNNPPQNSFSFSFDFAGTTVQSFANFGNFPYQRLTYSLVASAPVSTLKFNFRDTRVTEFRLDNVSVTGVVPEPATWGLMIVGFGLTGAAMRRRTARTA